MGENCIKRQKHANEITNALNRLFSLKSCNDEKKEKLEKKVESIERENKR